MNYKKSVVAIAFASVLSTFSTSAVADLSGSAGVNSMYLFRGLDLGTPQVWGSLDYSADNGFYASGWVSSVDGSDYEFDTVVGWGTDLTESVSVDFNAVVYKYDFNDFGDYADLTAGITAGLVSASVSYTVGDNYDDSDWLYYKVGIEKDAFSLSVGVDTLDGPKMEGDYTHIDFNYAYNDRLNFTVSQVIDTSGDYGQGIENVFGDEIKFLVGYTLPIDSL